MRGVASQCDKGADWSNQNPCATFKCIIFLFNCQYLFSLNESPVRCEESECYGSVFHGFAVLPVLHPSAQLIIEMYFQQGLQCLPMNDANQRTLRCVSK